MLLETARDTLFLASIDATRLPWMYLGIAFLALVILRIQRRVPFLSGGDCRVLTVLLVVSAAVTFLFWVGLHAPSTTLLFGLYIWTGVLTLILMVHIWSLLGSHFGTQRARRLYPLIGSGAVIGGIAGSALARLLVELTAAQHLVLVAAALLLVAGLVGAPALHRFEGDAHDVAPPAAEESLRESLARIATNPYAIRIAQLTFLATMAMTIGDYVFKTIVADTIPREELGRYFSSVYLGVSIGALVVQLAAVRWMLTNLRISVALSILPAVLLIGSLLVGAGVLLPGALVFAGAQGSLKHSLLGTANELLFVPLRDNLRLRLKTIVDVVADRGAKAVASILLLSWGLLNLPARWLGLLAGVMVAIWLITALRFQRHYVAHFRATLQSESGDGQSFPALDMASLQTLIATLNDEDDERVLAALNVLAEEGKSELIPALILYHPSDPVVRRAISIFIDSRRGPELATIARRMLDQGARNDRRALLLRALLQVEPDPELARSFLSSDCRLLRTTATTFLTARGWLPHDEGLRHYRDVLDSDDRELKLALAEALAATASQAPLTIVCRLLRSRDSELRQTAARALGYRSDEWAIRALIEALGMHETRRDARRALESIGADATPYLATALQDRGLARTARREIARVIAHQSNQQAADLLAAQLRVETDGVVRFRLIRELEALEEWGATSASTREAVDIAIGALAREGRQSAELALLMRDAKLRDDFHDTPFHELLTDVLEQRVAQSLSALLRCLALTDHTFDADTLIFGLESGRAELQESARAVLESVVRPPHRDTVLGLLPDTDDNTRIRLLRVTLQPATYSDLLRRLYASESTTIREVAKRIAKEVGFELPTHPEASDQPAAINSASRGAIT